jgi:hypothetical protein
MGAVSTGLRHPCEYYRKTVITVLRHPRCFLKCRIGDSNVADSIPVAGLPIHIRQWSVNGQSEYGKNILKIPSTRFLRYKICRTCWQPVHAALNGNYSRSNVVESSVEKVTVVLASLQRIRMLTTGWYWWSPYPVLSRRLHHLINVLCATNDIVAGRIAFYTEP